MCALNTHTQTTCVIIWRATTNPTIIGYKAGIYSYVLPYICTCVCMSWPSAWPTQNSDSRSQNNNSASIKNGSNNGCMLLSQIEMRCHGISRLRVIERNGWTIRLGITNATKANSNKNTLNVLVNIAKNNYLWNIIWILKRKNSETRKPNKTHNQN